MYYFCTITNILWLQIIEIKYISHIKKTIFLTTQPQSRSYRAVSKCHTAGRLMGDLQTLANIGKHRGMYTNKIRQQWDPNANAVVRDTTYNFYNVFDFNFSLSFSTKLYGFFKPLKFFEIGRAHV